MLVNLVIASRLSPELVERVIGEAIYLVSSDKHGNKVTYSFIKKASSDFVEMRSIKVAAGFSLRDKLL